MFYFTKFNKTRRHCHSWLAGQWYYTIQLRVIECLYPVHGIAILVPEQQYTFEKVWT